MVEDHIVKSFDEDLSQIKSLLLEMGGLVEYQMDLAMTALLRRDGDIAQQVVLKDLEIDELESKIDSFAIQLVATRQPMASDLRAIFAAPKIAHALERMGDLSKNIA